MTRRWVAVPILPGGTGGEVSDAAQGLVPPSRLRYLKNGLLIGPGRIQQQPDWLLADTCKNTAGTPLESHAVCGIFPFTQQGGASATVAGVAFSFNATDQKVYLHQVSENLTILRTFAAYSSFTGTTPPQLTGFEMFGKFYFCEYAREAATSRKGMGVFDPTGAGSVTIPTYDLIAGGTAAAALRFRGISVHRGATILGWGYLDEETGDVDKPHILRWCAYGTPDTWVPDTNPQNQQTAGFAAIGTLNLPIVACAMSDQFTIIGKETEVFALDGDYSSQFYTRTIGTAYGPVSTAGMVSISGAAVWMSLAGPAISAAGGAVQLLGLDQILRRFLNYYDLPSCWAAHDSVRHRVLWGLRRRTDDDGAAVTSPYLTECLVWDYKRNEFYASGLPSPVFCLGTMRGTGLNLVGPSGTVSAIAASNIQASNARVSWTPGDSSIDVTFQVEYRVNGTSAWAVAGITAPQGTFLDLSTLTAATLFDVRVAQIRNGQFSAYTTATALFTTLAGTTTQDPAGAAIAETGNVQLVKGIAYDELRATWTAFVATGTVVALYRSGTNNTATADRVASASPGLGRVTDPTYQQVSIPVYYWLRDEATDGSSVGLYVACSPSPITPMP